MDAEELRKLLRFAQMTTSSFDHEAIVAMRMLQNVLKRHGLTLDAVIERGLAEQKQVIEENADAWQTVRRGQWKEPKKWGGSPRLKSYDGIRADHLLEAMKRLRHMIDGWESDMLDSYISQNRDRKGLTEKQWAVLLRMAAKAKIYRPPRTA
jgi:hypothetical protein